MIADDEAETRRLGLEIAQIDEVEVRRLLGQWASELEPVICRRAMSGSIIGIAVQDRFGLAILPCVLEASMVYRCRRTQVIADALSGDVRHRHRLIYNGH